MNFCGVEACVVTALVHGSTVSLASYRNASYRHPITQATTIDSIIAHSKSSPDLSISGQPNLYAHVCATKK